MTALGTQIGALLAAGAMAVGGVLGATSGRPAPRTALVIDAAAARDGRALVDPRLRDLSADVRLPRTASEAQTDLRYFAKQGDRIVVAGPTATAAARATGVAAEQAQSVTGAAAALRR